MSKGKGSTTNVTDNTPNPWGPSQPYLNAAMTDLSNWYKSGADTRPFPGQSVAPMSQDLTNALGMVANRALTGSPLTSAAQANLLRTSNGDFLSPESNPFLKGQFNLGADRLQAQLGSRFNSSGNINSSAAQGESAQAYNQLAAQQYGGAYNSARDNQMSSAMFAPTMADQDYVDAAQMGNVGRAFEEQAGSNLTDSISRYNYEQTNPYARLMKFLNPTISVAGGFPVQSGSATTPYFTNGLSQGLGAAGAIGSLARSFDRLWPSSGPPAGINGGVPNVNWFLQNPSASGAPFAEGLLSGQPVSQDSYMSMLLGGI
jgi:hypothetical protein